MTEKLLTLIFLSLASCEAVVRVSVKNRRFVSRTQANNGPRRQNACLSHIVWLRRELVEEKRAFDQNWNFIQNILSNKDLFVEMLVKALAIPAEHTEFLNIVKSFSAKIWIDITKKDMHQVEPRTLDLVWKLFENKHIFVFANDQQKVYQVLKHLFGQDQGRAEFLIAQNQIQNFFSQEFLQGIYQEIYSHSLDMTSFSPSGRIGSRNKRSALSINPVSDDELEFDDNEVFVPERPQSKILQRRGRKHQTRCGHTEKV